MAQKKHLFLRALLIALLALAILAALVYVTGVIFFRSHFPFHTTFLGYDISEKEIGAIDECMALESEAQTLTLIGRDGSSETIPLSSAADYRRAVQEPTEGWIPVDNAWYWPQSLFRENDLSRAASISYDRDKLAQALDALPFMDPENIVAPSDAYLEWQDGILHIVPEVEGNELYRGRTLQKMYLAVDNDLGEIDLLAEGCYRTPRVYANDKELNRILARYKFIDFQQIEIDMTGETITLTPDDVLSFYELNDTGTRYLLSSDKVSDYVAQLKDEYDTYERSRLFVDHYGDERNVGTGADTYGFKLDADETTELLLDTLRSKESTTIEPVWVNQGWTRRENGSDIGDTYIEVSISNQRLWAYVGGEQILSTDVVTGNAGNHDTPRGVFRILSMARNTVLVGEDYESPVNYWMALTWRGVGLHDASWRSSFGGSIYTYNGSHGCINMPEWAARQLYQTYGTGTPVVVW